MKNKSIFRSEAPHQARAITSSTSTSRALMLDHYKQHLRTSTNRNGRPYTLGTISGYMRAARHLVTWLDDQSTPGYLTAACDPKTFNAFLSVSIVDPPTPLAPPQRSGRPKTGRRP